MTTKQQVIDTHLAHPDWTAPEIAAALDCHQAYVRKTAYRLGIRLPTKLPPRTPESLRRQAARLLVQAAKLEDAHALAEEG